MRNEDFIENNFNDYIKIDFSRQVAENSDILIKQCEKQVEFYKEQWVANILPDATCVLIKPGESYQWHFDSLDWRNNKLTISRSNRYYSEITYLTDGTPLQIGNFNGRSDRVYQTEFSAPKPTRILAEIYPKPGKRIIFPCFLVHRVISPEKNRWAIVRWIDEVDDKKAYASLWKRYFGPNVLG